LVVYDWPYGTQNAGDRIAYPESSYEEGCGLRVTGERTEEPEMKGKETTFQPIKQFPLRLCEVLEKEFVATHGQLSMAPDWLLEKADVCYPKLAEYFDAPFHNPTGGAISAIRDKLFSELPAQGEGSWTKQFEQLLLLKLNELLQAKENLYDHTLLDRDTAAWQLAELRASRGSNRQARTGRADAANAKSVNPHSAQSSADPIANDEQVQLNRILLEAALPSDAIARVDTSRLAALFRDIQNLCGPDGIRSALCLSGGGIRSAAFGLGVLGALARRGVLEKFDFLSTVSGGGYVGSWLSTWIHRHPQGLAGVVRELGTRAQVETDGLTTKTEPAPEPIRFLRNYSHFLNPKSGLFTADTWTWIGIYLRNLSLNWLVIIPFLLLVLAAPRLYAALAHSWRVKYGALLYGDGSLFSSFVWVAGFAVLLTLVCINVHRPSVTDPANSASHLPSDGGHRRLNQARDKLSRQVWILILGVLPLFVFAVVITVLVWGLPRDKSPISWFQTWIMLRELPFPNMIAALGRIAFDHMLAWGESLLLTAWLISLVLLHQP